MLRTRFCLSAILAATLVLVPARGDGIDDVEKKLVDAHAKVKSLSCRMKMTEHVELGEGIEINSTNDGTVEWMKKGDKVLYRSDAKSSSMQKFGGQEVKTEAETTIIADGEFYYELSAQGGQTFVRKDKPPTTLAGSAKGILDALRPDHELKVLPDDKLEGAECFVLEVTPKKPDDNPMSKMVVYFRKDCGVNVKTVGHAVSGKPMYTMLASDIKLNPDLKPDRFQFKMPENAEVEDLTKESSNAPKP